MWAAIELVLGILGKIFGVGKDDAAKQARSDGIELGEKRQQVATHAADNTVIHDANVAGKKAAQEPFDAPDPNDRDAAR